MIIQSKYEKLTYRSDVVGVLSTTEFVENYDDNNVLLQPPDSKIIVNILNSHRSVAVCILDFVSFPGCDGSQFNTL